MTKLGADNNYTPWARKENIPIRNEESGSLNIMSHSDMKE